MKFLIDKPNEYLKNVRIKRKYTLRQVSENINFSSSYISRMENGSSELTLELLVPLCNFYCIDITKIVEEDSIILSSLNSATIDLEQMILSETSSFRGKKIHYSDRLRIINFIDFITSTDNMQLKYNCIEMIQSIKIMSDILEGAKDKL